MRPFLMVLRVWTVFASEDLKLGSLGAVLGCRCDYISLRILCLYRVMNSSFESYWLSVFDE